jgi:outer membrane protein assembly factor BamE (lipoprotein component of BamABCDE complex)
MKSVKGVIVAAALCAAVAGCQSASEHRQDVEDTTGQQMTVGKVQREIRVGMSGAEVAQVLGSPNVVTTDEERREVWVYDKISTSSVYSRSYGGVSALIFGVTPAGDGLVGGAGSANYAAADGAASTTQKTLTVIIKFDEQGTVRDFAYHTSRF